MFKVKRSLTPVIGISSALMLSLLTGCNGPTEQSEIDNSQSQFQDVVKPIDIISNGDIEVELGRTATIGGRIVGFPIGNRSVRWVQVSGPDVTLNSGYDWTMNTIAFATPATAEDGIITYRFEIHGLDENGNVDVGDDGEPLIAEVAVVAYDPARILEFEVENPAVATLTGGLQLAYPGDDHYITGASGDAMTMDIVPGQGVTFEFDIAEENAGFYALSVRYGIGLGYGEKGADITVNGVPTRVMLQTEGQIAEFKVGTYKFDAGTHTVRVADGWNYFRLDTLLLAPAAAPEVPLAVSPAPINAAATQAAIDLKTYLTEQYTKGILSGQQQAIYDGENINVEHDKIVAASGEKPAIYSFDYMDYSSSRVENGSLNTGLTEDMIALRENGTILSAMWHWNAPLDLVDSVEQPWYRGFYTEATTFNLAAAMADETSAEYAAIIADLDIIAAELQKLQEANVPVLWRPLHEAEGEWFWWGAHGADNYKALWQLMYTYFTDVKELNNLLWVYSATENVDNDWYPGDDYVDIVGLDGYDSSEHGADNIFKSQWDTLLSRFNGRKMLALTETGYIPDTQAMADGDVWWSYFVTWESGDIWGPDNSPDIAGRMGANVVINAGDLPGDISGGESPTTPGMHESFDRSSIFATQVNWSDVEAASTSIQQGWSAQGSGSLVASVDLVAAGVELGEAATGVIVQTWTAQNASEAVTLRLTAYAENAGENVTAKLWAKDADGAWNEAPTAVVANGSATIEIDVTAANFDTITSFGVEFIDLDASQTNAKFYIDDVVLVGADGSEVVIDQFETQAGFEGQVEWRATTGDGISTQWSTDGARSMALRTDLSAESNWGEYPSVVIQSYPAGGLDVSTKSELTIAANSLNAGAGVTARIWAKNAANDWFTVDAVDISGGVTLTMDISALDTISGFGVQFFNFDQSEADAHFFIDEVKFDGEVYQNFELLNGWESQADWKSVNGATLSTMWGDKGSNALMMSMDLSAKTDWGDFPSVVLQRYRDLNLSGVGSVRLTAHAIDAGDAVTAKLWRKDPMDASWADTGPVTLTNGPTVLELDLSDLNKVGSIGVQFEGLDLTATDAKFFIDSIEFLAP